jgi:hypothetical protein
MCAAVFTHVRSSFDPCVEGQFLTARCVSCTHGMITLRNTPPDLLVVVMVLVAGVNVVRRVVGRGWCGCWVAGVAGNGWYR